MFMIFKEGLIMKLLPTLIAAVFAATSFTAVAADAPGADAKPVATSAAPARDEAKPAKKVHHKKTHHKKTHHKKHKKAKKAPAQ